MKKKALSVLLTVAILFSAMAMLVSNVFAEAAEKVNTINNYADLEAFIASLATNDYAGETVTVANDITVNDGWVANNGQQAATAAPTGDDAKILDTNSAGVFKGTFDGGNHTIKGLYINGNGMFKTLENATVQNITFDNCYTNRTVSTVAYIGIVAGTLSANTSATFTNVTVANSAVINGTSNASIGTLLGNTGTNCTFSVTDCSSMNNLFVSHAKTSLLGGFIGTTGSASGTFLRCFNSSEVIAMPESADHKNGGYKAGAMVGAVGGNTTFLVNVQECVNVGNITSFTLASGMVGDASNARVVISKCVNLGAITSGHPELSQDDKVSSSWAGGMLGRVNSVPGCEIIECVNLGTITARSSVNTKGEAGGFVGQCGKDIIITDSVNAGAVKASNKAGGFIGNYGGTAGTFTRLINASTEISGKDNLSTCGLFGNWAVTVKDSTTFLNVTDFYFAGPSNAFGRWLNAEAQNGNYKLNYTATGYSKTFIGGTDNVGTADQTADSNVYNKAFIENGRIADPETFFGVKNSKLFKDWGLGTKYVLTENGPMPATAYLMANKAINEASVNYKGYQKKLGTTGETFDIRLVAGLNSTEFQNTGFALYVVDANGNASEANVFTTTVYSELNVYNGEGAIQNPVTAELLDSAYLSAVAVTSLPAEGTFTLVIKPYVTLSDGSGVEYGSACAIVFVNGEISAHYVM